jgi:hypothetical protein
METEEEEEEEKKLVMTIWELCLNRDHPVLNISTSERQWLTSPTE